MGESQDKNNVQVNDMTIEEGVITLNMLAQGPDDPNLSHTGLIYKTYDPISFFSLDPPLRPLSSLTAAYSSWLHVSPPSTERKRDSPDSPLSMR